MDLEANGRRVIWTLLLTFPDLAFATTSGPSRPVRPNI